MRITLQHENMKESLSVPRWRFQQFHHLDEGQEYKEQEETPKTREDQGAYHMHYRCPSFLHIDILNTSISRKCFMHLQFIVFKNWPKRRVVHFLAPIMRFRETRETVHLYNQNKAMDIIKANTPIIGSALAKTI